MRKIGLIVLLLVLVGGAYYFRPTVNIDPMGKGGGGLQSAHTLEKYDFDELRKEYSVGAHGNAPVPNIEILGNIPEIEERRKVGAQGIAPLRFDTSEIRFQSDGKWVNGMINYFPEKSSLSPIIIMVRGYAEKEGYYPGSGSWKVADELAKAGFATISLDFLGYGNSDVESNDMLEARFHKVVEVLDLLAAVKQLPWVDKSKIGFWAHSNGGQIVMSILEITGEQYPTVMWAPMTQPFPDSVLSTIDKGSPVKEALDDFMKHYDTRRYAFENYYHWINSPILIQQGTADDQVKVEWQREVFGELGDLGKHVELEIYPGADHNLKGSWEEAVKNAIIFFKR